MDKKVLLSKMAEHGYTIRKMYTALGMSRSAFYRKCNGKSEFTLTEMNLIMELLNVRDPREIFFNLKVS